MLVTVILLIQIYSANNNEMPGAEKDRHSPVLVELMGILTLIKVPCEITTHTVL